MKKVLIISYFYPPANFAGVYRIAAWAKYLKEFGYEPIIVTRHWDENCTEFTSISKEKETSIRIEEGIKIYRTPYKGTFRDKLIQKFPKIRILAKILSFLNLFFSNYFLRLNPAFNLYTTSKKILVENPDIKFVLTSGRPFYQFQFIEKLKSNFPQIITIGDYRDPWNTNVNIDLSIKRKFFRFFEKPIEKRLIKNIDVITTCSSGVAESISQITKLKEIHIITNGFKKLLETTNKTKEYGQPFEIAYIGSLYENQKIEIFIEAIGQSANKNKFTFHFYGLKNQPAALERIKKLAKIYKISIEIFPWMPKTEMIEKAANHDALLICGLPLRKGTYTAKFFDYLSFQKNIILSPSDADILEAEIERLKIGAVLDNQEAVLKWIDELAANNFNWPYQGDASKIKEYTNENQVKKLAKIIENMN
jgi:hypothetical protein